MTRTEDDLRAAYKALPDSRDPQRLDRLIARLNPTPERVRRLSRRHIGLLAPLSAAAIVAVMVSVLVEVRHDDSNQRAQSPADRNPALTASVVGPITLRHPTPWRLVAAGAVSYGNSRTLGYLTTEPTVTQCATSDAGTRVSCRSPVPRLSGNGVLVNVTVASLARALTPHPNATVSGYPAQRTVGSAITDCPSGATSARKVAISTQAGPPEKGYIIIGCFGPNASAAHQQFDEMITTADIQPA